VSACCIDGVTETGVTSLLIGIDCLTAFTAAECYVSSSAPWPRRSLRINWRATWTGVSSRYGCGGYRWAPGSSVQSFAPSMTRITLTYNA